MALTGIQYNFNDMAKFWESGEEKQFYWAEKAVQKQWTNDELSKLYHKTSWRKARAIHLVNQPFCVNCANNNIMRHAAVVDHIIPLRLGGELLDESNLQSLCHPCHNSKSAHERTKKHI